MKPLGISINRLSRDLHVPANRIYGIVHGTRVSTPETALRPARYFGVTPETWMNLRSDYDLRIARRTAGVEIAKNREETRSRVTTFLDYCCRLTPLS